MKSGPVPDMMIAVLQGRADIGQKLLKPRLALHERPRREV
jgi:hypothetical protein